jgi:hypothetical protein
MNPTAITFAIALLCASLPQLSLGQSPLSEIKQGWATVPGGVVYLRPGVDAYEHSTGLVRDMRTGQKYRPLTPQSIDLSQAPIAAPSQILPYPLEFAKQQPTAWPLANQSPAPAMPAAPLNCPDGKCPLALPDFGAAPRGQVKTGGYACAGCNRLTVGDAWQTHWTPEGQPVTFVCRSCWEAMNPQQREAAYRTWIARQAAPPRTVGEFPR